MSRLMSVAYTEDAVRARTKRVTRRLGWWEDRRGRRLVKPGDHLTLCRKVMGRKPGEPLVRIVDVEVLTASREQLDEMTDAEVALEGFPGMSPEEFIRRFFVEAQGVSPTTEVTRIEWRYLWPRNVRSCICLDGLCLRRAGEYPGEGERVCQGCRDLDAADACLQASIGATATCRTCRRSITFETVQEHGYLPRTGWSEGWRVDALICFRANHYRHVPDWVPAEEARR